MAGNDDNGKNAVLQTAHKLGFFIALPAAVWLMLEYWPTYGAPNAFEFFAAHFQTHQVTDYLQYAKYATWAACGVASICTLLLGQMLAGMVLSGLYWRFIALVAD